jgi:hypothetical protein
MINVESGERRISKVTAPRMTTVRVRVRRKGEVTEAAALVNPFESEK